MLNTLRSVIDDDPRWFALLHDFYQHFKYQNIMTEDVVAWFNQQTGLQPHAHLQPVPAPHRHPAPRAQVRSRCPEQRIQFRELSLESRRGRLRDAGARWRPGPLADHPPHHPVANDEDASHANYLRRRHRPLLHQREQRVVRSASKSERATSLASRRPLFRFFEDLVRLPDHNLVDLSFLRDLRACARVSLILPRSLPLRELPRIHPRSIRLPEHSGESRFRASR